MYLVRWFENLIRNKSPLKITILIDDIYFTDVTKPPNYPKFFLPINFTNRAIDNYEISFSNFNIKPKKISSIEFSLSNRVFEEKWKRGTPENKFSMDKNSKSGYLLISIRIPKGSSWDDVYKTLKDNKKISFEVSFDYRLSTETKKRTFNKRLPKLMESVVENVYNYKSLYEK